MFPPRLISRNLILFFSVFILTCLLLVLFDSFYYGEVTLRKLWDLDLEWSDWKCAPLNFIMYNVVPGNLAQHGSHPFYLHTLVNIPLLFGPLGKVFFICHHLNIVFEIPFNIFFRHRNALVNPLVYHGHVSIFLERETRGPNCLCFNCLHLHRLTRTSIHLPTPGIVSLALSFNQSGYFNLAFYFFSPGGPFHHPFDTTLHFVVLPQTSLQNLGLSAVFNSVVHFQYRNGSFLWIYTPGWRLPNTQVKMNNTPISVTIYVVHFLQHINFYFLLPYIDTSTVGFNFPPTPRKPTFCFPTHTCRLNSHSSKESVLKWSCRTWKTLTENLCSTTWLERRWRRFMRNWWLLLREQGDEIPFSFLEKHRQVKLSLS